MTIHPSRLTSMTLGKPLPTKMVGSASLGMAKLDLDDGKSVHAKLVVMYFCSLRTMTHILWYMLVKNRLIFYAKKNNPSSGRMDLVSLSIWSPFLSLYSSLSRGFKVVYW